MTILEVLDCTILIVYKATATPLFTSSLVQCTVQCDFNYSSNIVQCIVQCSSITVRWSMFKLINVTHISIKDIFTQHI